MKKRRRFTPEFKAQVVLEVLTGAQSPAEVCRRHALGPNLLTTWKATVLQRLHTLFQGDEPHDEDQARIAELEQLLGRATRQIEVLLIAAQRRSSLLYLQSGLREEGSDQVRLLPKAPAGEVQFLVQFLQVAAHDVAQSDVLEVMPPALIPGVQVGGRTRQGLQTDPTARPRDEVLDLRSPMDRRAV